MTVSTLEVRRKAFAETRLTAAPAPDLAEGDILVAIDKFAMTANNVSYALSGDMIGYWKFFPVAEPWGVVPVWGFADVIASRCPAIAVGERVWGFLPMASHVVLRPHAITARAFVDGADHRRALPPVYNAYQRTSGDSADLTALENERCLLFPLFSTSYLLCDYLVDNAFFGARQVLVGSASSKTGFGLCNLLSRLDGARPRITGLTSPRNVAFVQKLGVCDSVETYDAIGALDAATPTAFVDMAGAGDVVDAVHAHFGQSLKVSIAVGATHWNAGRPRPADAAVPHTFFFAPAQIQKREQDWGPGEVMRRATGEAARISRDLKGAMTVRHEHGATAVAAAWARLVANETPPDTAIMASLTTKT